MALLHHGELPITLIRSKRRRTIALEISKGQIKLRCPARASDRQIQQFLEEHSGWLDQHAAQVQQYRVPARIDDELNLTIKNIRYRIVLLPESCGRAYRSGLSLCIPCKTTQNPDKVIRGKLIDLLRDMFLEVFEQDLHELVTRAQRSPASIQARNYSARWGSCDRKGNLRFNVRLIFAPPAVVRYVIAHELAHLDVFDHSRMFWRRVEQLLPDYREPRRWLKEHGWTLNIV